MTTTSQILQDGLSDILAAWAREGGERDPFYWIVRLQLAHARGGETAELARVPDEFRADLAPRHAKINAYFDNVRYALLDPAAAIWGTVVNSLRVAAGVPSVTPEQKSTFDFPLESLVAFVRAAHATPSLDALHQAFRPMPAPDCQALAALLHPNARLDARSVGALVRMLSAEGPLTVAEAEALAVLTSTGLAQHAFRGLRSGG